MLSKSITIVAAGLAAATNAFLLPPGALSGGDVSTKSEPAFSTLPVEIQKASEQQDVNVDCPGCPITIQGQTGQFRMRHGSSHLELGFSISHAAVNDRLLVNGFELYPRSDPFANTLAAAVVPEFESDEAPKSLAVGTQELGFSLMVRPTVKDEATQTELVTVDLQIIEVGNKFISGLNSVRIDLIRSPNDALVIAKIEQIPAEPAKPKSECTTMTCRWKAFVNEYVNRIKPAIKGAFKGCGNKMGGHHKAAGIESAMGRPRPGAHMHHNHHHSWAGLFSKFSHLILLPILIGIVAGISVSIIGAVVGTLVIGLWRVFVRGQPFFSRQCPHRRRSGSVNKASANETALLEEKSGLMDDAPPSYTDDEESKPASA